MSLSYLLSRMVLLMLFSHHLKIASAFNNSPVSLQEELGCSPTLAKIFQRDNLYFDPLSLATDDNFARYREAELKHGRVAMITVIWSWISFVSSGDSGIVDSIREGKLPPLFRLLQAWPIVEILKFTAICGILETLVLVQVDPQDMPGDYRIGYLGVRDKGRHERSLVTELENGRLAMLVMFYYLIHDIQIDTESYQGAMKYFVKLF